MLVVISPAKRLDWAMRDVVMTQPDFLEDANRLARTARNLTLRDLQALMKLSPALARLNRDRFRAFAENPDATLTRPAALAFAGDTYLGLAADTLAPDEMAWAQEHLRILSGLYGVLRPLDAIQPYRLEMGCRLKTRRGASLYAYWRDQLARALMRQAQALATDTLLNCASTEYFSAAQTRALTLRVVTPVFLEDKDGTPGMVSFFAKKARGAMARFVVQNRLTSADQIVAFDLGGYAFDPERSTADSPVFVRPCQTPAAAAD